MGLKKRTNFDHTQESVFDAAGYGEDTVDEEITPRAANLANQLVRAALTDPETAIDVVLGSPVLKDADLDSRDRAIIVIMAGHFLASAAIAQLRRQEELADWGTSEYELDFPLDEGHREALDIGKVEWDTLVHYVEQRVFGEGRKESERVEKMEEVLEDGGLNPLQKAVAAVLVMKNSATETSEEFGPVSLVS
jgi:hypothetical protein